MLNATSINTINKRNERIVNNYGLQKEPYVGRQLDRHYGDNSGYLPGLTRANSTNSTRRNSERFLDASAETDPKNNEMTTGVIWVLVFTLTSLILLDFLAGSINRSRRRSDD